MVRPWTKSSVMRNAKEEIYFIDNEFIFIENGKRRKSYISSN